LANTIDLEATLVRAEALFRRFQRTVEAIDKMHNFPAPRARQRPVSANLGAAQSIAPNSPGKSGASGTTTGADVASAPDTTVKGKFTNQDSQKQMKVISPELRKLLSRRVEVLPRKVVQKKGEGLTGKNK